MGCIFTRELDSHAPFPGCKGGSRRASRKATPRHPYLGGTSALPRGWVRQHLVKKVGTPRRRGPKIQVLMRRFPDARAALPRGSAFEFANQFLNPSMPRRRRCAPEAWVRYGEPTLPFGTKGAPNAQSARQPLSIFWRAMLCLARAPLATPFGPSTMCFLNTAQCFGCRRPLLRRLAKTETRSA